MSGSGSDQGFIQDYTVGKRQDLFIYCRLCRAIFPVAFKPRPTIRLRCLCGHEGPLSELDVFRTEAGAKEHASFYEKVYQAAKSALREAGVPLPPSGKFRMDDYLEPGSVPAGEEAEEDSDLRAAWVGDAGDGSDDGSETTPDAITRRLADLKQRVDESEDTFARHAALTETIEWSFIRRRFDDRVQQRLVEACREDIALAPALIALTREQLKQGQKARLSFASFKHLAIALADDGDVQGALDVVERAIALGLKGYDERRDELKRQLDG